MSAATRSKTWSIADAKAHFSEVFDLALTDGPQTITRRGKPAVVMVAADEWERGAKPEESFVEFLNNAPLRDSGLVIEREKGGFRELDL